MWQRFGSHRGMLRASALSFDTTLAFVPVLALIFVLLQKIGVQELLEPFILQQLTGNSSAIATKVHEYVCNTRVAGLGSFSILLLVFTLLFLLESIREAFNAIWGVTEHRSLLSRCLDYLLILAAVPLLLTTAIGITSLLQSQWLVQWLINNTSVGEGVLFFFRLTPFFCSSLMLVLVYLLLPAVKVRFASAMMGGVVAGACWQLAHWLYFRFQFGVTRYNAIYGALSLMPFLLIWIYTSWLVVLLGFELVRYHQQGCLGGDEAIPAGMGDP
ncbi:MAG: YihY/virulence factor BrkB family protein [Trichlorobacter sp.]|uniref:YihY/virulence factor BrkB family protein n=1 Tax=Trichlorobacter sp. TaxID=2911007 RepID=UPI00256912FB|nr:YihY/virulence factor BrkB family protein [Trichlorobacter sp.]MDK9716302.1 YihY/virulence factor BrkB family protein [Trichlorobacter sp.]